MTIENVIEKFDIPDEICFSDIEPLKPTILLSKGKYLIFYGDKTNYVNEKFINTIDDDDIEEYLLISKEYRRHLRMKKLQQLNDKR